MTESERKHAGPTSRCATCDEVYCTERTREEKDCRCGVCGWSVPIEENKEVVYCRLHEGLYGLVSNLGCKRCDPNMMANKR